MIKKVNKQGSDVVQDYFGGVGDSPKSFPVSVEAPS